MGEELPSIEMSLQQSIGASQQSFPVNVVALNGPVVEVTTVVKPTTTTTISTTISTTTILVVSEGWAGR